MARGLGEGERGEGGLQVTNGQSFSCSHIFWHLMNGSAGGLDEGERGGEGWWLQVTNGQSAAAAH